MADTTANVQQFSKLQRIDIGFIETCPACKSFNFSQTYHNFDDGSTYVAEWKCKDCSCHWLEEYKLAGVLILNPPVVKQDK